MKKSIVLIYLFACLITMNMITVSGSSYELQVTFSTNPIIVNPGTYGYIEVILKNVGSSTVTDIRIEASSWDVSVIKQKGNWEVTIGDLKNGDTTTALYEFYVPTNANPELLIGILYLLAATP